MGKMTKSRVILRAFLMCVLMASLGFFGMCSYIYVQVRLDHKKMLTYAPMIFTTDAVRYRVYALTQDQDGQYQTAILLYHRGFFSSIYRKAGIDLLKSPSLQGHKKSQQTLAEFRISYEEPEK